MKQKKQKDSTQLRVGFLKIATEVKPPLDRLRKKDSNNKNQK